MIEPSGSSMWGTLSGAPVERAEAKSSAGNALGRQHLAALVGHHAEPAVAQGADGVEGGRGDRLPLHRLDRVAVHGADGANEL